MTTLLLHEQLLLLALDDEKGTSRSSYAEPALAGAVLLDLLSARTLTLSQGHLMAAAGAAPPAGVLSDVKAVIAEEPGCTTHGGG